MATFTILPEILLIIMEHMDMKELLDVSLVNRAWYDAATSSARIQLSRFLFCIPQLRYHQVVLDFRQAPSQTKINYGIAMLPEEKASASLRFFLRSSLGSYATLHSGGISLDTEQGIKFKLKAKRERPVSVEKGIASASLDSRLPSLSRLRVDLMSPLFPTTLLSLIFRCNQLETPTSDGLTTTQINSTEETLELTDILWWIYPELVEVQLPKSVVDGLEVVARPSMTFDPVETGMWSLNSLDLDIQVRRRL